MAKRRRLPFSVAASVVIGLWAPYTILNTFYSGPAVTYLLGLLLAGVALAALRLAGLGCDDLGLRLRRPSGRGAMALAALSPFAAYAVVAGQGRPWITTVHLVIAPASAIAQELYFRSALLSVVLRLFGGRHALALVGQALLFAAWHLRAYRVVSAPLATGVLAVVFVGGLVWGWQVWRDRTIAYAAAQHTLFLTLQ